MIELNGTDISFVRGDSVTLIIETDTRPLMYGDVVRMMVREPTEGSEVHIYKKVTEFENGKAYINIEHSDTANMAIGKYAYDIKLTDKNGKATTLIENSIFRLRRDETYGYND